MKFVIGTEVFPTKGAAQARTQVLLHKYSPDEKIRGEDVHFLWTLLQLHPRAVSKIGCGVVEFFVQGDRFGGQRFCVRRVDGSEEHFSYPKCFRSPTKLEEVSKALRNEVEEQVVAFKRQFFGQRLVAPCSLTGELIDWYGAHVDHYDPDFAPLRDSFLLYEALSIEQVELSDLPEGGRILSDRLFAARWTNFHQNNANLRVTSKAANMARARRVL